MEQLKVSLLNQRKLRPSDDQFLRCSMAEMPGQMASVEKERCTMPNLLLYVEAQERLDQLRAAAACPAAREANALAYPEELFTDRQPDPQTESAHDRLLDELFDGRRAARPEYVY